MVKHSLSLDSKVYEIWQKDFLAKDILSWCSKGICLNLRRQVNKETVVWIVILDW